MTYGEKLVEIIDNKVAADNTEDGLRTHLGASVLGEKCMRQVWYSFRWFATEQFSGRMLRLFARGQREEAVFFELLRATGAKVWTHNGDNQFRVSWFGGHLGGSLDGVAILDGIATLLECKTHNDKSFKELATKGVWSAKPKHYAQAQIYMAGMQLTQCLYIAVNKNDDTLYLELFAFEPDRAQGLVNRAETIIFGDGIPNKISNSPAWYECRFCPMHEVCHRGEEPLVNCRTCKNSRPERDGTWSCDRERTEITTQPKAGCTEYQRLC
jgi:hypothetical protein